MLIRYRIIVVDNWTKKWKYEKMDLLPSNWIGKWEMEMVVAIWKRPFHLINQWINLRTNLFFFNFHFLFLKKYGDLKWKLLKQINSIEKCIFFFSLSHESRRWRDCSACPALELISIIYLSIVWIISMIWVWVVMEHFFFY